MNRVDSLHGLCSDTVLKWDAFKQVDDRCYFRTTQSAYIPDSDLFNKGHLGSVAMVDSEYKVDTERQHTSATLRDVQEQLKSATSQVPSAEANVRKSRSSTDKGITTPSSNLTDARTTLPSLIHSAVAKGREDLSADLTVVATPDGLGSCTHLHGLLA